MVFQGRLNICTEQQLKEDYVLGKQLGKGTFSVVYEAKSRLTGQKFAAKVVTKSKLKNEKELRMIYQEIKLMQKLNHGHIVALYRVYESTDQIFLILEHLNGGELFSRIVEENPDGYSEYEASNVFAKVLEALAHVHEQNIVHRDLKPENLIYVKEKTVSEIKLTDFGLSKECPPGHKLKDAVGTPQYVAPEVITGTGHDTKSDMWSLGVILYILLCGGTPFFADNDTALFHQIVKGEYGFPEEYFGKVSKEAKDLVRRLLRVDPRKRLSAREALAHPWIANRKLNSTARLKGARENLRSNLHRRRFKNAGIAVVASLRLMKCATDNNVLRKSQKPAEMSKQTTDGDFNRVTQGMQKVSL